MSQAREFVELFVELKTNILDLIRILVKRVVCKRLAKRHFYLRKNLSKRAETQLVLVNLTALYRTALKSKLTVAYRSINASFVELLLNCAVSKKSVTKELITVDGSNFTTRFHHGLINDDSDGALFGGQLAWLAKEVLSRSFSRMKLWQTVRGTRGSYISGFGVIWTGSV